MKRTWLWFGWGVILVLQMSCGNQAEPAGSLIATSSCKGALGAAGRLANLDCLEYQYDGQGILKLRHVNAAFNCCPGKISADIEIKADEIIIREKEEQGSCSCDCLYDLDYLFSDIKPGTLTIRIIEPYVTDPDSRLEMTVDLSANASGSFCVERSCYPWL